MSAFQLAAQLYTVRNLINDRSEEEIYLVLKALKEMGYTAVQISGVGIIDQKKAEVFQSVCRQLELDICATHLGLQQLEEDLDWVVQYHQMWGCHYVGIGAMPVEYRSYEGAITFAGKCNAIGKVLAQHNMHLIYHNHKFEFEKFYDKTLMQLLFEQFDPRYVEFEIDTYWVQAGGENPVDWIYKVNHRMGVIHFKDFRICKDEQQFAEVGQGNLNWENIIEACHQTDVVYAAVEQDRFTEDPLKSLRESIMYLSKLMP